MTSKDTVRRRLGRGLESLMSGPVVVEAPIAPPPPSREPALPEPPAADAEGLRWVAPKDLLPDPLQPRQTFDEASLERLAASIRQDGLMQPIVVRPVPDGLQIVAGERRWRAAQSAGLETIPVLVRELDDKTAAQLSLVENLQREDLNPIERAEAFLRLNEQFALTHQQIAARVGLDRASVSNHIRLTELVPEVKELVRTGALSMGHGRALLGSSGPREQVAIAQSAVRGVWTVRELERRIRAGRTSTAAPTKEAKVNPRQAHLADLERKLGEHLGTKVRITTGRKVGAGHLQIEFFDLDQFEGLLDAMGFRPE